jgi:hypothetical protein
LTLKFAFSLSSKRATRGNLSEKPPIYFSAVHKVFAVQHVTSINSGVIVTEQRGAPK